MAMLKEALLDKAGLINSKSGIRSAQALGLDVSHYPNHMGPVKHERQGKKVVGVLDINGS